MTEAQSDNGRYEGGCQCGAVRFRARADLGQALTCNCSRCRRLGSVMTFTPASEFELVSGEDALTDYMFNKHVIRHRFCSVCGIQSFAEGHLPDGTAMIAINANCLDGVDTTTLSPTRVDGRSF